MGWFSRNPTDPDTGRRSGGRSAQSGETQLRELRVRARRRLVGALALVIVAVIFVPMLFDSSPPPEELPVPVVVPAIEAPNLAGGTEHQVAMGGDAGTGTLRADTPADIDSAQPVANTDSVATNPQSAPEGETGQEPARETSGNPPAAPSQATAPKPEPDPPRPPARAPAPRTDDGSVALALLEGRAPAAAPSSGQGSFTLQIAAYTTEADARSRRDKLVASGVTNAYVESASIEGKPTYRLRVGPFRTRDAAQAAQARLRALGYDNGFISSQ